MSRHRATDGRWQCTWCELWYDDDEEHDMERCYDAMCDAADHKRKSMIEDAELYRENR